MQAVISGRAGKALLLDEGSLKSFDVADPATLVSRQMADLPYLFGDSQDLRIIEGAAIESIARELENDYQLNLALDLTLLSLDPELPDHIRLRALQNIERLTTDDQLVVGLENIIYARPVPEDGDLAGALTLCSEASITNTGGLLRRIEEHQSLIGEVSASWQTIPTKVFGSYENQAEFQRLAVREGLFRSFVLMRDGQRTLNSVLLRATVNASVIKMPNYWPVLQHWSGQLSKLPNSSSIESEIEGEFEMVVPTGAGNELVVASTVEQIARKLTLRPEVINKIQQAVVEVFLGASEDSLSPNEKIRLRFRFEGDRLIVTVSNTTISPRESWIGEKDAPDLRGWGLKLIATLTDEVQFETVDDDTIITRNKDLQR